MIRYFSILCFVIALTNVGAQPNDIYNLDASKEYASYLNRSGQHLKAASEYERIYLLDSNAEIASQILNSYRKAGTPDLAIKRYREFANPTKEIQLPYLLALIENKNYLKADSFLSIQNSISYEDSFQIALFSVLYQLKGLQADSLIANNQLNNHFVDRFKELSTQLNNLKKKKKGLAVLLSVPVPGLGRMYSGSVKDGLFSMLFVGTMTWQSYVGFKKNGIKSIYGWIFGTLGTGFYLGNLYGSYRAAAFYNHKKVQNLLNEIDNHYRSIYL